VKLLNNITDFYHGQELLSYHCRKNYLTEGDQFLTFKPINATTFDSLYKQISILLSEYPIRCVGVIEAERSLFQQEIQNYRDQFIPESFFHCHMIAKDSPDILPLERSWIEINKGYKYSIYRKEVNNLPGLVCYLSKQINHNPTLKYFFN
jgi:hypothetical protein